MRDARKLFRLFKTLNEYQKILDLLEKSRNLSTDDFLAVLSRVFFGLYWIFDNIAILRKIGILSGDSKPISKKGSICWLLALLTGLILVSRKLVANARERAIIQKYMSEDSENSMVRRMTERFRIREKTINWFSRLKRIIF